MYIASYIKHKLVFNVPAGTSRGVLSDKESWFIRISYADDQGLTGIGECSIIPGLSIDKRENIEHKLDEICSMINDGALPNARDFLDYPAIQFGFETAMQDLQTGASNLLFPSDFTRGLVGIPINGLIWMGSKQRMLDQVETKIKAGFRILKLKVGAISFGEEREILKSIRQKYSLAELEIRLDANGAWDANEAPAKLEELSKFDIHSLEQPIASGQISKMEHICRNSPINIALDEELIGLSTAGEKQQIISTIKPAYIIIKPSLLGGFKASEEWISAAKKNDVDWWLTSALESNIGLNAIAQWTATLDTRLPQGLGTGQLFRNNITSPLRVIEDQLFYLPEEQWDTSELIIDL